MVWAWTDVRVYGLLAGPVLGCTQALPATSLYLFISLSLSLSLSLCIYIKTTLWLIFQEPELKNLIDLTLIPKA